MKTIELQMHITDCTCIKYGRIDLNLVVIGFHKIINEDI